MKVALATGNPGKVREIRAILEGVDIVPPDPAWIAPEETEPDYRGNAFLKARSLAAFMDMPALADDSGIETDALDGKPGPRSARFAGPHATDQENLDALIDAVRDRPRGARYRCVAVLVTPGGREAAAEGAVEGTLVVEPRGSGGFGYDPIFVAAEGDGRTMAEMTPEEKDAISHRGRAFRALLPAMREILEGLS